jgi:hypothetical protein
LGVSTGGATNVVSAPPCGVTGSLTLPEFGVAGMAPVGRDVWIVSPSGGLVAVR